LVAKGDGVHGFEIAGIDKKFYNAQAKISGNSVIVWSEKVPNPVAVRYGWASNPDVNLFNRANLPTAPFRTDKWVHHWGKKKNV
jgi:sialate O-acetylesterase